MSQWSEDVQLAEEAHLIAAAQSGNREALGQLLMGHQGACYMLALRLTGKASDAEDVCQDAFVRAARDIGRYIATGSFRSWLFALVVHAHRNRCISDGARQRREKSYMKEREGVSSAASAGPESGELHKHLILSLGELDENRRLPIVLHYEQGLSYSETAAVMNVPEGTVATNIRRGLDELRERLSRAGYGALAIPALAAALSQAPGVAVPATLTAFTKTLAAGGAVKSAAAVSAKLGAAKAAGLALGWKVAIVVSAATIGAATVGIVAAKHEASRAAARAAAEQKAGPSSAFGEVPPEEPEAAGPVFLQNDFEDGRLPPGWHGAVEQRPQRPGNRYCIMARGDLADRVTIVKVEDDGRKGLFRYREGTVLTFDYWVDDTVWALDVYLWDRTQAVSIGRKPILNVPQKQWVHAVILLADLRSPDGARFKDGDVVADIAFQTSPGPGTIYLDNIKVALPQETDGEIF